MQLIIRHWRELEESNRICMVTKIWICFKHDLSRETPESASRDHLKCFSRRRLCKRCLPALRDLSHEFPTTIPLINFSQLF